MPSCIRRSRVASMLLTSGLLLLGGCASKQAAPTQPEPPDMQAMMEAVNKAMTPGPEHARLAKAVGTWDGAMRMWFDPAGPPQENACVSTFTSIMGGRYTECRTSGRIAMGEAVSDFEGRGIYGFNNVSRAYESIWIDNMGTAVMVATGHASADGRVINWSGKMTDPAVGKAVDFREVETWIDDDTMLLEMYGPGADGKEFKSMEISFTRRK